MMNNKGLKFLLVSILSLGIINCGGGGSDSEPEPQPTNQKPSANAGADQTVDEQTAVTVEGSGTDSDGTVTSYSWAQTSGPEITLSSTDQQNLEFTAPVAKQATSLEFTLTVTDNDGAKDSDSVVVTVNPIDEQKVTLQGVVTDGPISNAQVTAEVAGRTYTATADASGNYTLEISEDEDVNLGEELVSLTAVGVGDQAHVKLKSVIDNFDTMVNQAGDDKILTADENSWVNVTHVSTAILALIQQDNNNQLPATAEELALVSRDLDEREIMSVMAAIKLVTDFADESPNLALPSGITDTWEFINNKTQVLDYLAQAHVEPSLTFYNEAIKRTLDDTQIVRALKQVPDSYTGSYKPLMGYPADFEQFEFSQDGAGQYKHANGIADFTWTNDSELYLDFNASVIEISSRKVDNGTTLVDAVQHRIYDDVTIHHIASTDSVDIVKYELNWRYHYPNGELPDEINNFSTIGKFVKKGLPFQAEDIVGVRMLPLKADFLEFSELTSTSYGELENLISLSAGRFEFKADNSVVSDIPTLGNGNWQLTENEVLKVDFNDYIMEVTKLADNTVTVILKDIVGNYQGIVTGQTALNTSGDLWGDDIVGVYTIHGSYYEPLSYLWLELNADGTGQRVDAYDANVDGQLQASELLSHPISWRKVNGSLVIERYKDLNGQACETLRVDCFIFSRRLFELFEVKGENYYIKTHFHFNIEPLMFGSLDEELTSLWSIESLQTRYWTKTEAAPISTSFSEKTYFKTNDWNKSSDNEGFNLN